MAKRRKHPIGIRPWKGKWQAYVRVNGELFIEGFPANTPIETMKAWREKTRRKFHVTAIEGSLQADIRVYLHRVSAMPTFKQREAHLKLWAAELGRDRPRQSVTAAELDAIMQRWLTTPTNQTRLHRAGRPSAVTGVAPGTVRKRRTSLLSFYAAMLEPEEVNPVERSACPQGPKPEARAIDYRIIRQILEAIPESTTKRRIVVLAYTGLPPGLLATVTPLDLDLKGKTLRVRPRRKGAGVEARTVPLTPDGVIALKAFHQAGAYGAFSVSAANVSFKRGCAAIRLVGPTLYDLRHSFLTLMYRATGELATTARFGLHASLATTARYAQAAMKAVDEDAARKAGALLSEGRKLSPRVVRR